MDINLKKVKVKFVDVMDVNSGEQLLTLNELFLKALSMNSMGFSEGYETEYMVAKMIESKSDVIDIIDAKYKLDLINAWDYEVLEVTAEDGTSLQSLLNNNELKGSVKVDNEKIFTVMQEVNENSQIDDNMKDCISLALFAIAKWNNVYTALNDYVKNIIQSILRKEEVNADCKTMKHTDLKSDDIVIFKRYCSILGKEDYQDGNVVKVHADNNKIDILWLEGYKSRIDSVDFENVIAKYDSNGVEMKFGVYSGKSILLKN